jgi:hypothetical protein
MIVLCLEGLRVQETEVEELLRYLLCPPVLVLFARLQSSSATSQRVPSRKKTAEIAEREQKSDVASFQNPPASKKSIDEAFQVASGYTSEDDTVNTPYEVETSDGLPQESIASGNDKGKEDPFHIESGSNFHPFDISLLIVYAYGLTENVLYCECLWMLTLFFCSQVFVVSVSVGLNHRDQGLRAMCLFVRREDSIQA